MTTFRNYILANYGLEMPGPQIPGTWFSDNGIPMIVSCACCGMTMSSPSAWIDSDGYCYCSSCAGAADD